MTDKTYKRILIALLAACVVFTVVHAVYAVLAYPNSSIIHYVSKEWW